MSVYNENGGFTIIANDLSIEIGTNIKPILINYLNKGMTIEEILYVVNSATEKICLRNQVETRINKRKLT
jgi:hypothetical protein